MGFFSGPYRMSQATLDALRVRDERAKQEERRLEALSMARSLAELGEPTPETLERARAFYSYLEGDYVGGCAGGVGAEGRFTTGPLR